MQLRYGTAFFPTNACQVSRQMQARLDGRGVPMAYQWSYSVTVMLRSNGVTALERQQDFSIQEATYKSYLSVPGQDLVFLDDSGAPTNYALYDQGSEDGVNVTFFGQPGSDEQYIHNRTFSFTATATYPITAQADTLLSFQESVQFRGFGGPRVRNRIALDGTDVRQIVLPKSMCSATQSGQSVGYLSRPFPPPPLWPADWQQEPSGGSVTSPTLRGHETYVNFATSWNYYFERVGVPFSNVEPNRWIV